MELNIKCHGFSVNGHGDKQQQFHYAAQRFVDRWQCKPVKIWHHEATPLPETTAGIETAVDNQIPRNAWYFEIPEEVMKAQQ